MSWNGNIDRQMEYNWFNKVFFSKKINIHTVTLTYRQAADRIYNNKLAITKAVLYSALAVALFTFILGYWPLSIFVMVAANLLLNFIVKKLPDLILEYAQKDK